MILNEEQIQIRDMARDFARERLMPGAAERDATSRFPREELREMGELATQMLLSSFEGAPFAESRQVIETGLIVRGSSVPS